MPSRSAIIRQLEQIERVLDEVRRGMAIHEDENPTDSSVLFETDRNTLVSEGSPRETSVSEIGSLGSGIRGLTRLPSPQGASCLDEAEQHINADDNAKRRTRPARHNVLGKHRSSFDSGISMTPDADVFVIDDRGRASANPMSLNARRHAPEVSAWTVDPTEPNRIVDLLEAINTALRIVNVRSIDARIPAQRQHPLPTLQRTARSGSSRAFLETTGSTTGGSRHSSSSRRPDPPSHPPRQPRTTLSTDSHLFSLPRSSQGPLDPRASQQGDSGSHTNCMIIRNSTVNRPTMNNGGSHNSGSASRRQRSSRRVPAF